MTPDLKRLLTHDTLRRQAGQRSFERGVGYAHTGSVRKIQREAVGLLQKIRVLFERLGREKEFAPYVAGVRAAHRPKRNFMALLDAAGWK